MAFTSAVVAGRRVIHDGRGRLAVAVGTPWSDWSAGGMMALLLCLKSDNGRWRLREVSFISYHLATLMLIS